jgi:lysozyme
VSIATWVAVIQLIVVHSPAGQEISINAREISSIRQPRDALGFSDDVRCLIFMNNGKFIATTESCFEIIRLIADLDQSDSHQEESMPRIDAVDLSHWNATTSQTFVQLAKAGVVGVIHKCTEGTSYLDPTYRERMQQALDAELLLWGAYHFLKHGSAAAQMKWFISNADLPPGSRIAIDYEDGNLTLDDLNEALEALDANAPDLEVAIYGGSLLKEQIGASVRDDLADYPLWLAQYTSGTPSWPTGTWPSWSLWQYTDKGNPIPGDAFACDCNTFNGSQDQCAEWFGPIEETPPVEAVEIDIKLPPGVDCRVTINGEPLT